MLNADKLTQRICCKKHRSEKNNNKKRKYQLFPLKDPLKLHIKSTAFGVNYDEITLKIIFFIS